MHNPSLLRRETLEDSPAKLIVDFDQEVGQPHAAHLLCQPGFEEGQTSVERRKDEGTRAVSGLQLHAGSERFQKDRIDIFTRCNQFK